MQKVLIFLVLKIELCIKVKENDRCLCRYKFFSYHHLFKAKVFILFYIFTISVALTRNLMEK